MRRNRRQSNMVDMLRSLFNVLWPALSLTGVTGTWVTDDERTTIERLRHPLLIDSIALKHHDLHFIDAIVAGSSYAENPLLRSAIHRLKYRGITVYTNILADIIAKALPGRLVPPESGMTPVLVPVPLHWTREFSRGFNQSHLLCRALGPRMEASTQELLRRIRATGSQTDRSREERIKALDGAFAVILCSKREIPPWVILVDDVCTTGATMNTCAKALKRAGVKYVSGLTVAYG